MGMLMSVLVLVIVPVFMTCMMILVVGMRVLVVVMVMSGLLGNPELLPGQFLLAGGDYIDLGGADTAASDSGDFQPGIHPERRHRPREEVGRNSGVDQRAKKHVATDPGKAFEVSNSHRAPEIHHRFCRFRASNQD